MLTSVNKRLPERMDDHAEAGNKPNSKKKLRRAQRSHSGRKEQGERCSKADV